MATRFELLLAGDDPTRLRAIGEEALEAVTECEATLSAFRPGSLVSTVNRRAHAKPVPIDSDTFALLAECQRLGVQTDGAFDALLGSRMRALGFRRDAPSQTIGPMTGPEMLVLDAEATTVRLAKPGLELDLGAIAKGHALDRAADVLRAHGVCSALLHGGSSAVVAIGTPPGGDTWRVALGPWPDAPIAHLRDAALAVSAPHGRGVVLQGERIGHVLDPRTGRPATNGVRAAAVLAHSARTADAWSTALLVLGTTGDLPLDLAARIAMDDAEQEAIRWVARGAEALSTAHFDDR